MTKICIFGAGAIGGMMAHALHKAGAEVSLVARGPHLAAIREKGLTFVKGGQSETIAERLERVHEVPLRGHLQVRRRQRVEDGS